jgi:hypothetical protein
VTGKYNQTGQSCDQETGCKYPGLSVIQKVNNKKQIAANNTAQGNADQNRKYLSGQRLM